MTDKELRDYRFAVKESILHYLCDDWDNHKRGKAHRSNQAIFDRDEGFAIFCNTDLEMVMEKVVKGIWATEPQLSYMEKKYENDI